MPRGNGTGPLGVGPMTGRGAGYCAGFAVPGYANPTGYGFGRGRGFRRMFYATGQPRWARFGLSNINRDFASDADEKEFLKRQAKFLENQLVDVKKRLDELED
ncbi:MAG: DUF5320 domain-containing protein [Clostridiaceae bacterium]|nr:DUF5320 domain-containing protein [Clostridiaceae bacterium]